jgi:hypothetical protein
VDIDELLNLLDNAEDGDGQKTPFFLGERFEITLTEMNIDNLRAQIGVRHGTFVEFDSERNLLPFRNNSGNIAHDGLDVERGICQHLYAKCKDYCERVSSTMFHPDARGCVIWLVPTEVLDSHGFDAVRNYVKIAQVNINWWGP